MSKFTAKQTESIPRLVGLDDKSNAFFFNGNMMITTPWSSISGLTVTTFPVTKETSFDDVIDGFKKLFAEKIASEDAKLFTEWDLEEIDIKNSMEQVEKEGGKQRKKRRLPKKIFTNIKA